MAPVAELEHGVVECGIHGIPHDVRFCVSGQVHPNSVSKNLGGGLRGFWAALPIGSPEPSTTYLVEQKHAKVSVLVDEELHEPQLTTDQIADPDVLKL